MAKICSWEGPMSLGTSGAPRSQAGANKIRTFLRKPGGGRKPMHPRKVFESIVYVLRSGCQWKALPKEQYSNMAVPAPCTSTSAIG